MDSPSPRKFVNGSPVYMSRPFELPRDFGAVVLSDFGSAVRGDLKRNHDAQPTVYRSPEVMLKAEWIYPVDIWNVGVMVRVVFCFVSSSLFVAYSSSRQPARFGIYSRASTCLLAKIQTGKVTRPAHTLPR